MHLPVRGTLHTREGSTADRIVHRIPEQTMGYGSDLQKNETLFLVLDGGMILFATTLLTVFHPAVYFPYMTREKGESNIDPYYEEAHELRPVN